MGHRAISRGRRFSGPAGTLGSQTFWHVPRARSMRMALIRRSSCSERPREMGLLGRSAMGLQHRNRFASNTNEIRFDRSASFQESRVRCVCERSVALLFAGRRFVRSAPANSDARQLPNLARCCMLYMSGRLIPRGPDSQLSPAWRRGFFVVRPGAWGCIG